MPELLESGLILTAVGMGTVFLTLGLLVLIIGWLSKLCERLAPRPAPGDHGAGADAELVSVVTAAVQMFRRDRGAGSPSS